MAAFLLATSLDRCSLARERRRPYDFAMFTTNRVMGLLLAVIVATFVPSMAAKPDQVPKERGLLDRLMNPDRSSKSPFEGKVYKADGEFSDKKFSTGEFSGTKEFASKTYETKGFEGSKKSWLGKLLFPEKKLPENLQGAARESGKTFESKDFAVTEFGGNGKVSSFASKGAFETKEVNLKGKTQGAIDSDPHLQDAIKKGLTIDDVKKLLNKPGGGSQ